jgi:hypothetical protein
MLQGIFIGLLLFQGALSRGEKDFDICSEGNKTDDQE